MSREMPDQKIRFSRCGVVMALLVVKAVDLAAVTTKLPFLQPLNAAGHIKVKKIREKEREREICRKRKFLKTCSLRVLGPPPLASLSAL
jgi:hypothetical protein